MAIAIALSACGEPIDDEWFVRDCSLPEFGACTPNSCCKEQDDESIQSCILFRSNQLRRTEACVETYRAMVMCREEETDKNQCNNLTACGWNDLTTGDCWESI